MSIEEKVFKRPDKEKKVSTTVTEEEIRISPPEVSDDVPRRKLSNKGEKQRRSSEERKKKKEEKKGKNSKEEKFRSVSFAQILYTDLIYFFFKLCFTELCDILKYQPYHNRRIYIIFEAEVLV